MQQPQPQLVSPIPLVGFNDKDGCSSDTSLPVSAPLDLNRRLLFLSRVAASIVAGIAAGILGVPFLNGFAVYVIVTLIVSGIVYVRIERKPDRYFASNSEILVGHFFSSIMCFVLFWTLFYDIVHIFGW